MNQKIWIINDETGSFPAERRLENRVEAGRDDRRAKAHKNPALAFSLSLLVWGSGHLYLRDICLGSIFLGCMLLFYAALTSVVVFWEPIIRFVAENHLPLPLLLFAAVLSFTFGLCCWLYNAVHAYSQAADLRIEPFRGASNELWPLLGSLILPGWGQFMNGQPKKGLFFLLFGALSCFSVAFMMLGSAVWPILHSSEKFLLEIYLYATLLVIPLCLLMWLAAAHDAFWSCREPVRKRPFRNRWQFARERIRTHGISRYLLPKMKAAVLSGLLLALAFMVGRQHVPKSYYLAYLEKIEMDMMNYQMRMIPELVGKAIRLLN
jgi:TM2 domain-containing membrane protein YozV